MVMKCWRWRTLYAHDDICTKSTDFQYYNILAVKRKGTAITYQVYSPKEIDKVPIWSVALRNVTLHKLGPSIRT